MLKESFGLRHDPQDVIEKFLSMELRKDEDPLMFIDKASKAFIEAGFTKEQKFVFCPEPLLIQMRPGSLSCCMHRRHSESSWKLCMGMMILKDDLRVVKTLYLSW